MKRPFAFGIAQSALCGLLLLFLSPAGCGSSTETPMEKDCGEKVTVDPTALIDDMEAPDAQTSFGRNASWWAGGDDASKAAGAMIVPDGTTPAEEIPGGRCGSKYAVRVTGQGFGQWSLVTTSMGWGPRDGKPDGILPYDASFRTGVTFWARVGDTSTDQVRLNISDQYSNDMAGICDPNPASAVGTKCYDHFGTSLANLSTEWTQYTVPFKGLKQQMFGIPRPELDTTHLYTIDFNFPVNSIFDFWVDDLSFY
jgi:hypothetical protein